MKARSLLLAAAVATALLSGCAELSKFSDSSSPASGASSSQPSNKPGSPNSPYPYNSPWG